MGLMCFDVGASVLTRVLINLCHLSEPSDWQHCLTELTHHILSRSLLFSSLRSLLFSSLLFFSLSFLSSPSLSRFLTLFSHLSILITLVRSCNPFEYCTFCHVLNIKSLLTLSCHIVYSTLAFKVCI